MSALRDAFAELDEKQTLLAIQQMIDRGEDPKKILAEARRGLQVVGERFEARQYALIELEMADELFRECVKTVEEITNRKDLEGGAKAEKRTPVLSEKTDQGRVD
jgi:methanogenic corrinoid protein MtbC1